MWRRTYLLLIAVRIYLALSPSYLHPDEHFQGPEFIAGRVFSYPVRLTWEFTSDNPIRSIFPLWLVYGWPMLLLQRLWEGLGYEEVSPEIVYWALRIVMLILTFVLQDSAVHELVHSHSQRRCAVMLTASSYVTWTYQTHTFSNSVETLVLLWCMVLVERIIHEKHDAGVYDCALFAFLAVAGTFNRITFPAFLLVFGLRLFHHLLSRPLLLATTILSAIATASFAIILDTSQYRSIPFEFQNLYNNPIITPLNSLLYNSSSANLAAHGLHPYYQHFAANLPLLLGPAFIALIFTRQHSPLLLSAFVGTLLLSIFPHQEARFLLPAVPLALSAVQVSIDYSRMWIISWIGFNTLMGVLMGVYHQGGVVPAQMYLAGSGVNLSHAFWWKTYSPPTWLLDGKTLDAETSDLMGLEWGDVLDRVAQVAPCKVLNKDGNIEGTGNSTDTSFDVDDSSVYLIAPLSATALEEYIQKATMSWQSQLTTSTADSNTPVHPVRFQEMWRYKKHLNLDDLDVGTDGIWNTLKRVVGKRGLAVWRVSRQCE